MIETLSFQELVYLFTKHGSSCINTLDPKEYLTVTLNEIEESEEPLETLRDVLYRVAYSYRELEGQTLYESVPWSTEPVGFVVSLEQLNDTIGNATNVELNALLETLIIKQNEFNEGERND